MTVVLMVILMSSTNRIGIYHNFDVRAVAIMNANLRHTEKEIQLATSQTTFSEE